MLTFDDDKVEAHEHEVGLDREPLKAGLEVWTVS